MFSLTPKMSSRTLEVLVPRVDDHWSKQSVNLDASQPYLINLCCTDNCFGDRILQFSSRDRSWHSSTIIEQHKLYLTWDSLWRTVGAEELKTCYIYFIIKLKTSVAWVRELTIPTELPSLVGEASAKFFADRGCHVVRATDPYCRILGFLDRSRYFFLQVALQLHSRGWVDPVLDPLLLRKSGSSGNQILELRICSQELWPLDHRGGLTVLLLLFNLKAN
jgi:hypothetical protein